MNFFDEGGNPIHCQEWLETYEPYYYLGGPTIGRKFNSRQQSSRFVEDQVCALLEQTSPLSRSDLILAMAWKIGGLINQVKSEASRRIEFDDDWPTKLISKGGLRRTLDFSRSIPFLADHMDTILEEINKGNPRYIFDGLVPKPEGFGPVYILTVLFFITRGKYPIYDKYAHIAAQAIHDDLPPASHVEYKGIGKWDEYVRYMDLLRAINDACPQFKHPTMFVSRPVDRALWVYGHFFKTDQESSRNYC